MPYRHLLLTLVLLAIATSASAATLSYQVTVNTSSQLGNPAYLDLQLNPGSLISEPVEADLSGFFGAVLNPLDPNDGNTGDVTGALPGDVTLANTDTTNEYFEALTFGSTIKFNLTLSGTGVDPTGNAGGTSGTAFVLDFLDPSGDYLFSTDPTGSSTAPDPLWAVAVINIDNTGLVTVNTNPNAGGGPSVATISTVPEPAAWGLLGAGLLGIGMASRLRRRSEP
jgi:hypothetical protein